MKKKRFFLDFWPYVNIEDVLSFWALVAAVLFITFFGGWLAFLAGMLFVLPFFGYLAYENDRIKHFF